MRATAYVINPTSTVALNAAIALAAAPLRIVEGLRIEPVHLPSAPPAIESQGDSDFVAPLICKLIRELDDAACFVIACFSDPGLHAAREAARRPVYGIAECGLLTAMTKGQTVGVLSILPSSLPRHWRMYGAMGIAGRIGGDLPIGLGVGELADNPNAFSRLVEVGTRLRDDHRCDVLVLGCAGMAAYQGELSDALAIPVVDPVRAATAFAVGQHLLLRHHALTDVA